MSTRGRSSPGIVSPTGFPVEGPVLFPVDTSRTWQLLELETLCGSAAISPDCFSAQKELQEIRGLRERDRRCEEGTRDRFGIGEWTFFEREKSGRGESLALRARSCTEISVQDSPEKEIGFPAEDS